MIIDFNSFLLEKKHTNCGDCGGETEFYFLNNDLWNKLPKSKQNVDMCLSCIEKRIGRKLRKSDFRDHNMPADSVFNFHSQFDWWNKLEK